MHTDSSASLTYLASAIRLRMDHDGLDAERAAGALDAQRDFAAVGDQDFFKHLGETGDG